MKLPLLRNNNICHCISTKMRWIASLWGAVTWKLRHLQILFLGCISASELCHLEKRDLDLKNHTIRFRGGKGGRDGIALIMSVHAPLSSILKFAQPPKESINLYSILILTDDEERPANRMFLSYRREAGVDSPTALMFSHAYPGAFLLILCISCWGPDIGTDYDICTC